jgi:FdhE protein
MPSALPQPELIGAVREIPALRLPSPDLFARRAGRARALAEGHDLGAFLRFAAVLAEAQQDVLDRPTASGRDLRALLDQCRIGGMPPLAHPGWQPDPHWAALARSLAEHLTAASPDLLPDQAKAACARILASGDVWLAEQGHLLLDPDANELPDLACAPLIGAAMQVCWTAQAARLSPDDVGPPAGAGLCPVCGSPPVASIVRVGGAEDGARYLHCGLCASEWRLVRSQCSQCNNSRGITYLGLESRGEAVKAEACPECRSYLKICRMDKDLGVDPWADDLATMALDWLVDQEGFTRAGINFMLIQPEAPATPA